MSWIKDRRRMSTVGKNGATVSSMAVVDRTSILRCAIFGTFVDGKADNRAAGRPRARLLSHRSDEHHLWMITFEQFVTSLGDHAHQYTAEQLRQLHLDVQRFAQVIIAINRAKQESPSGRSPQRRLDDAGDDRILKREANNSIP